MLSDALRRLCFFFNHIKRYTLAVYREFGILMMRQVSEHQLMTLRESAFSLIPSHCIW